MSLLKNIFFLPSTRYVYRNFAKRTVRDPGIQQRKKLVGIDNLEEVDDFEDFESDFMDTHKYHKDYVREMEAHKEREKYLIVKQKYFKENLPNFLTWHDKEQIRYLHRTEPEEWTIERLSDGFPALPDVIKKIVKSNWTKTKQNKITNHDESVQKNWKLFKDGKKMGDLPEDVQEHLKKFTSRELNLKPFIVPHSQENTIQVKDKNVGMEFADIIRSYENLKKGATIEKNVNVNVPRQIPSGDTYVAAPPTSKSKFVTLDELQSTLKQKIRTGLNVDQEEKSIVDGIKPATDQSVKTDNLVDLPDKYEQATGIRKIAKPERDNSHLNYPEKIHIPKKIYKKGFTYKLNDCYYDDDGEFLYRVPGMS